MGVCPDRARDRAAADGDADERLHGAEPALDELARAVERVDEHDDVAEPRGRRRRQRGAGVGAQIAAQRGHAPHTLMKVAK